MSRDPRPIAAENSTNEGEVMVFDINDIEERDRY